MTQNWLERPQTIRRLWNIFAAILALSLLVEVPVTMHGKFGVDGGFGFNAWFGFAACVGLILFAKALGLLVKRPDTYYDD